MDKEPIRMLITGGSGFIGTNAVEYFKAMQIALVNIDNCSPRNPEHRPYWQQTDLLDELAVERQVLNFKPTIVLHLAARTDLDETSNIAGYRVNTMGVENLIKALRKCDTVKRVIITSSMFVCAPGYQPESDEDFSPHTLYGESKVMTEMIIRNSVGLNFEWVIIRPTSIWGPWFGEPYKAFFDRVKGGSYVKPGGKVSTKTFGFVLNALYQIDKIMFADAANVNHKVFYIGDSPGLNINAWADAIAKQLNRKLKTVPLFVFKIGAMTGDFLSWFKIRFPLQSFRLKNMTTNNVINRLDDTLKIVPERPYSIEEGVRITLKWMAGKSGKVK